MLPNDTSTSSLTEHYGSRPKYARLDEELMSLKILPILSKEICDEEVPLIDFYVISFIDKKKFISQFLKCIPSISSDFDHLKRVDKMGRVLVQSATIPLSQTLLDLMKEYEILENEVIVVKVPALKPTTRQQFEWAKRYWPTSFHPDKQLESLLDDTFFSDREKLSIRRWCKKAIEIGSIVVQNDEVLASGSRTDRLLGHCVMNMVQNLAKCDRQDCDYLATGCDVYLRDEPCAMCAMV
ncbi:hypothetical protein DICVIV_02995 [Dictyocaulus viviparus]|uniref:CMP/dCMP-type deaminase domain-containing protein n=1 Tax=Dictyocaulus viviparus TaxID=29172 RepID=A0A0D8Y2B6_DICVI|nr:hypothetical protein DICVIV_02995 [Dictyocaulus viviparus]